MTTRGSARRPPNTLTIQPPSPGFNPSRITTPINQVIPQIVSPRKAPLPPSPTYSNHSNLSGLSAQDSRTRKDSFDTHGVPHIPRRDEKRLPGLPFGGLQLPRSPRKRGNGEEQYGQGAGMYDNRLVTSTLSQLPPIPPLSPTPTGNGGLSPHISALNAVAPSMNHKASYSSIGSRPAMSTMPSSVGVVLPDGTSVSTLSAVGEMTRSDGRSVKETLAHSSPSSPWSLLTIHVLPIFAGSPLKSPMEDLNHLCHSHIIATSQRTAPSRLVAVLSSDLRDFIASGMLTLKSKMETADDTILIPRIAETWKFFWTHILFYLEGVFLPFSQMRDLPSSSAAGETTQPIPVRHILLSGFLLNIPLPLLSRLNILVSNPNVLPPDAQPTIPDMQQVLQMILVLGTQARYSSFVPLQSQIENDRIDGEIKENVQILGRAVRWRIGVLSQSHSVNGSPAKSPLEGLPKRSSLQRVSSQTQGRHRRPGWRASNGFGSAPISMQTSLEGINPSRQNSDFFQPESRWGRPRVDEEDEDDRTPGQNYAPSRQDSYGYASTATTSVMPSAASTLTAGTWKDGNDGHTENQRTPQADYGRRGLHRRDTEDSEATPLGAEARLGQRM